MSIFQLSLLVTALLSSLITDRQGRERIDSLSLVFKMDHIEYAGQILRKVLDNWATPVNQLRTQTLKALREYVSDGKFSHASHFGALKAMIALGPDVIEECLLPQLDQYLQGSVVESSNNIMTNGNGTAANVNGNNSYLVREGIKKNFLYLMHGTLLMASRMVLDKYVQNQNHHTASFDKVLKIYQSLERHFGDSICICALPSIPHQQQGPSEDDGNQDQEQLTQPFVVHHNRVRVRRLGSQGGPEDNSIDELLLGGQGARLNGYPESSSTNNSKTVPTLNGSGGFSALFSTQPVTMSYKVRAAFEPAAAPGKVTTVNICPRIRISTVGPGCAMWSEQKLKNRKTALIMSAPRVSPNYKSPLRSVGVIKRLTNAPAKLTTTTTASSRSGRSFNSCSISHVI